MNARQTFDWTNLREAAREAAACGYAPYSGLQVGAAGLTRDGLVVTGCNVENASFGLTLCAECGLVSSLRRQAAGQLVAVTCCDALGNRLAPCGRCRQLLLEHGGVDLAVDAPSGVLTIGELLPDSFGFDPPA